MIINLDQFIMLIAAVVSLALLIFAVNWHYFRDWIALFFFKCTLDFIWGSAVENLDLLEYPVRLLPEYFETSLLFEAWVLPILCILYNQTTRKRGLGGIIWYALLFSALITAIEYPLELYTNLIKYKGWSWFTSYYTLTLTFLASRVFIAFYRWGCDYFGQRIDQ